MRKIWHKIEEIHKTYVQSYEQLLMPGVEAMHAQEKEAERLKV